MVSRSTAIWLLVWIALAIGSPTAWGQVPANSNLDYPTPAPSYEYGSAPYAAGDNKPALNGLWPFSPGHVGSYAQPFSPARTSTYGNGPHPNEGYFFSYERLFWSLSAPETSTVGAPPLNTPSPGYSTPAFGGNFNGSIDSSFIKAIGAWGNRWEIGYADDTNFGWLVSVLDHVHQGQYQTVNQAKMTLGDPNLLVEGFLIDPDTSVVTDVGQLPGLFQQLLMQNLTTLNGLELSRTYRAPRLHGGGFFEVIYGARWFQLDDAYIVTGLGNGSATYTLVTPDVTGVFPLNVLADSYWATRTLNNLIGAQIGLRWFRQRYRWVTSADARFLAAANFQNTHQVTDLGTLRLANPEPLPAEVAFLGLGTNTHVYNTTFAPMGELRVNVSYNATSKVALKVGYTGIIVGNVSRASNRVDYNSERLIGITPKSNNEIFFVNGLSFGVEVNR